MTDSNVPIQVTPDVEARVVGIMGFCLEAETVEVADAPSYERALLLAKAGKERLREIEAERLKVSGPLNEALQQVNSWFRAPKERLAGAIDALARKAIDWKREEESRERERQRVAQLAAEAEARRLEKLANKAEAKGNVDQSAALHHQASSARLTPAVGNAVPRVAGITTRETWKWRCAVAGCGSQECEHLVASLPKKYLSVNTSLIGKVVRAEQKATEIPGVEVYPGEGLAGTRG